MEKVTITLQLDEAQADALAEFVKRCGWSEWRQNAVDEDEAHQMKSAFAVLQKALADTGFAPR